MKKILTFVLLVVFLFVGIVSADGNIFKHVGYYKDKAKHRIFAISYKKGVTEDQIKAYALKLMNTKGRFTAGYFYPEGSKIPAGGLTQAGSLANANYILYDTPGLSKWHYAYMHTMDGKTIFVDCVKHPKHDLSRQK